MVSFYAKYMIKSCESLLNDYVDLFSNIDNVIFSKGYHPGTGAGELSCSFA